MVYPKSPMVTIELEDDPQKKTKKIDSGRIQTLRALQAIVGIGSLITLIMSTVLLTLAVALGYPANTAQVYIAGSAISVAGLVFLLFVYHYISNILTEQLKFVVY